MSLEDLESDVTRNAADLDAVVFASFDDIKTYLKQTMFPLMTNVVEELAQMDEEIAELVEGRSDMLTPETAGIFAAVIAHCLQLVATVRKLRPNDAKTFTKLDAISKVCKHAQGTLLEITVVPDPDEEDEEGGDEPADMPDGPVSAPVANEGQVADGNA